VYVCVWGICYYHPYMEMQQTILVNRGASGPYIQGMVNSYYHLDVEKGTGDR
jgi:hypothetical protein